MTKMQQKMDVKPVPIVTLVGANAQCASRQRPWRGVRGSPAALIVKNSRCT